MTNRVMVVTVAAMALAVSCLVASGSAAAFTARDMLGRDVALAAPPKRIISLVPSVTEILYALNGEHLLVGVTDVCDFPPEAKRQPKVGGMVAPSLEAIIARKPDLVIATTEGTREDTFTQLSRVGVPVYLVAAHHVADATSLIRRLGELTRREHAAGPLMAGLERRIGSVEKAAPPLGRPRERTGRCPDRGIVPARDATG